MIGVGLYRAGRWWWLRWWGILHSSFLLEPCPPLISIFCICQGDDSTAEAHMAKLTDSMAAAAAAATDGGSSNRPGGSHPLLPPYSEQHRPPSTLTMAMFGRSGSSAAAAAATAAGHPTMDMGSHALVPMVPETMRDDLAEDVEAATRCGSGWIKDFNLACMCRLRVGVTYGG